MPTFKKIEELFIEAQSIFGAKSFHQYADTIERDITNNPADKVDDIIQQFDIIKSEYEALRKDARINPKEKQRIQDKFESIDAQYRKRSET